MNIPDMNFTVHFVNRWFVLVVPMVLMALDVLVGFLNAWRKEEIKSSALRDGIMHKFGEVLIIVIALFLQYTIALPKEVTIFASVYIIIMELISILENLAKLGVKVPEWLTKRLHCAIDDKDTEGEKTDDDER